MVWLLIQLRARLFTLDHSLSTEHHLILLVHGEHTLQFVCRYTYLGLLLNEYLDYHVSAKCLAQSAGRALGCS